MQQVQEETFSYQLCSYSNLVSVELNYVGLDCNNLIFLGGGGVLKADFFLEIS